MRNGDGWTLVFGLGALGNLANGAWMLLDPIGWYRDVPGVTGSGPLNEHFVRDVGATFTLLGLALAWGAARPALRRPALAVVAGFYVLHALVHVLDTARGLFPPGQWRIDAVPIYLPALLLLLALALLRPTPARG
jgi:hypothetical protein